jgi:hypothetical protein
MDWMALAGKDTEVVDKRGGTESVLEDAKELGDIAGCEGSLAEKGKQATAAIKEPGAPKADQ